jgi:sec-independent protein translocase protein TatC
VLRAVLGAAAGVGVCLFFQDLLFKVLFWPLGVATGGRPPHLFYRSLAEPFTVWMQVVVISGLILSCPYGLYQMWRFISAGLYRDERRAVGRYVLPSVGLFLLGAAFFFVVISPVVVRWFLTFGEQTFPNPPVWGPDWLYKYVGGGAPPVRATTEPYVQPILSLGDYIAFTAMLSLVFGLAFQMPLVVVFLVRTGLMEAQSLRKFRRYVLAAIVIAAAVITPTGDAITMLAMAAPMYLLYEVGLLAAGRGQRARERAG